MEQLLQQLNVEDPTQLQETIARALLMYKEWYLGTHKTESPAKEAAKKFFENKDTHWWVLRDMLRRKGWHPISTLLEAVRKRIFDTRFFWDVLLDKYKLSTDVKHACALKCAKSLWKCICNYTEQIHGKQLHAKENADSSDDSLHVELNFDDIAQFVNSLPREE